MDICITKITFLFINIPPFIQKLLYLPKLWDGSSDDSDDEDINLEDTRQGNYVLYKFTENKYYVAAVIENTSSHVVLSCTRKYEIHQNKITITWPKQGRSQSC